MFPKLEPHEDGLHDVMVLLFRQPQRTVHLPVPEDRRDFLMRPIRMSAAYASMVSPCTSESQCVLARSSCATLIHTPFAAAAWKQSNPG